MNGNENNGHFPFLSLALSRAFGIMDVAGSLRFSLPSWHPGMHYCWIPSCLPDCFYSGSLIKFFIFSHPISFFLFLFFSFIFTHVLLIFSSNGFRLHQFLETPSRYLPIPPVSVPFWDIMTFRSKCVSLILPSM